MVKQPNDVVITGIGIVTCHGTGKEPHIALLSGPVAPESVLETDKFKPYIVHPLPEIDWSEQVGRKDQRQMENWQRLGVFAAGLALDDAKMKDDMDTCGSMDLIVAAGGGERDIAVDSLIVDEALTRNDRERLLIEKLKTELRPTLFLAQLSNLLAGNISIVHKVTGSSRTFMGEESAGISAIETAFARIKAGQSTHTLVGGAFIAERSDILLLVEGIGAHQTDAFAPLWARDGSSGGGMILGTVGAFLVLESREHAEARGAHIYAVLDAVEGDRGNREGGGLEQRLQRIAPEAATLNAADTVVFSGASGLFGLTQREKASLEERFPGMPLRGYAGVIGHSLEAQFPAGLALAALAIDSGAVIPAFDAANETAQSGPAKHAIVSTVGYIRGEGLAVLSADA